MIKKQDVMTPYMENEARNNSQSIWVPGTQGTHPPGTQGTHPPGAQGTHPPGAQGTHPPGAQGMHPPGAQGMHRPGAQGRQVPSAQGMHPLGAPKIPVPSVQEGHAQTARVIEWRDLTLNQQRILEWLVGYLLKRENVITFFYKRISTALKISQRAARVHTEALKKKRLISTEVVFRPNSHQKIGLRVSIAEDAPIKHLPHRLTKAEDLEMRKRVEEQGRKEAQAWDLLKRGFVLVPELNSYVLPPENLRRR